MKRYKYKAKDSDGNAVQGEVEASTKQAAAKLVRGRGLVVISLKPASSIQLDIIKRFTNRITSGDVATFTRQLATMINAGLPLTESLLILRSQVKGSMQKIVGQILADVEEGESLSSSMKKYPEAFSKTYIALIKSGEVGGVLDEVLVRLADNLEKQQEFKGKVKGALIYPAIVIAGMFIVALVMLIFVIPQLTSLYDQFDAELPLVTKILIGVSDFMQFFWPFLILLIGGGFYGYNAYRQTENGRRKTDELLFKIPIMGDLQKQIILTDLTRTMSLMVGSGVSILEGLTISSEVVGNRVISDALEDAADLVEKGFPVAFAFSKHPEAFPFILSQMVAVGEETGKMDEVLIKVSHVFEVESEQKVKALTSSVEPIILLFLGVGVAFLVVAIILPIYNLTTSL
jgi:type IV pilus assembly protein PilC